MDFVFSRKAFEFFFYIRKAVIIIGLYVFKTLFNSISYIFEFFLIGF